MAVYTHIDKDILRSLQLPISSLEEIKPIAEGIDNSNYIIKANAKRYVLTIIENMKGATCAPILTSSHELSLLGLPHPKIIYRNLENNIIGKPVILAEFVEGEHITEVNNVILQNVATYLAKLHNSNYNSDIENRLSLAKLNNIAADIKGIIPVEYEIIINQALFKLNAVDMRICQRGFIHADLFPDNIKFYQDGSISGVFDFYFACEDYYLYDLAIALNAWCFDNGILNKARFDHFISIYKRESNLPEEDFAYLNLMLIRAALRIMLTRLYDKTKYKEGDLVIAKDPLEYKMILEAHMKDAYEYASF